MRKQFLIFIAFIIALYTLINYFLFAQGKGFFDTNTTVYLVYVLIFWTLAFIYPVARILGRLWCSKCSDVLTVIGSFWFAVMLYLFLGIILLKLIKLMNLATFVPYTFAYDLSFERNFLVGTAASSLVIIIYGFINARIPRVRKLDISINKPIIGLSSLTIAVASDIHLGNIVAGRMAKKIVKSINRLNPDIILLAGDVVDEDLAPVIRFDLGECLKQLKAPLGIYAITGNHEYIGGVTSACQYLQEHGIRVLRDEWIQLENGLYIVGRDDRDKSRFTGETRRQLSEIMMGVDKTFPVILLDHQPFELDQAATCGADLSISGHTHHGQMWPLNYITRMIYELSWGYKKKGDTHCYVSCGVGTWGPQVRTGNRPEILSIKLKILKT
ncbi:MAG: metallophosphoesterase [Bacteroidetes bacterium]|nr:metallophosphoesterase [Bacteroidota bacterium]